MGQMIFFLKRQLRGPTFSVLYRGVVDFMSYTNNFTRSKHQNKFKYDSDLYYKIKIHQIEKENLFTFS